MEGSNESGGSLWRRVTMVIGPVIAVVLAPAMAMLMPRCDGGYKVAFEAINQCPAATEVLGSPIRQATVGVACGESETSPGSGQAQWQLRVSGPNGAGTYRYRAVNRGQGWRVIDARLTVKGNSYQIEPCLPDQVLAEEGPTATPGFHDPVRFATEVDGRVAEVHGGPPVAVGDACAVTLSPSPEEAREVGFNCHVKVRCGDAVLYGWEGAGITRCKVEGGVAVSARDDTGASAGDDPFLTVDVPGRTAAVADDPPEGPWRVEIAFDAP